MSNKEKLCIECEQVKVITEFIRNKNSVGGYTNVCKQCAREAARAKQGTNPWDFNMITGFKREKNIQNKRVALYEPIQLLADG
jgi:protein-arginine kinase activator protein McsA